MSGFERYLKNMEHVRDTKSEGWKMVVRLAVIVPIMSVVPLFFDVGTVFGMFWFLILLVGSGLGVSYAIFNIRSHGSFVCRLTEDEFTQSVPVSSCGDSFQIKLSEITLIEIHDSGGEGPSDEWYLHTKDSRNQITANYENPYRKFGEAIQRALPQVQTIKT